MIKKDEHDVDRYSIEDYKGPRQMSEWTDDAYLNIAPEFGTGGKSRKLTREDVAIFNARLKKGMKMDGADV